MYIHVMCLFSFCCQHDCLGSHSNSVDYEMLLDFTRAVGNMCRLENYVVK